MGLNFLYAITIVINTVIKITERLASENVWNATNRAWLFFLN